MSDHRNICLKDADIWRDSVWQTQKKVGNNIFEGLKFIQKYLFCQEGMMFYIVQDYTAKLLLQLPHGNFVVALQYLQSWQSDSVGTTSLMYYS